MAKKPKRKKRKDFTVAKNCPFCKNSTEPNWRNYEDLKQSLSPRSRILGKDRTGICAKHQRRLAESIKQARHLGLLPFITQIKSQQ